MIIRIRNNLNVDYGKAYMNDSLIKIILLNWKRDVRNLTIKPRNPFGPNADSDILFHPKFYFTPTVISAFLSLDFLPPLRLSSFFSIFSLLLDFLPPPRLPPFISTSFLPSDFLSLF